MQHEIYEKLFSLKDWHKIGPLDMQGTLIFLRFRDMDALWLLTTVN